MDEFFRLIIFTNREGPMAHILQKLQEINRGITSVVNSIIIEMDMAHAYASAMYFIKGKEFYDELLAMPKLARNTLIGKMMGKDDKLYPQVEALLLKWLNEFMRVNDIRTENFLEASRDAILIVNKRPIHTIFENGIVEFRNKASEYTSFHRINGKVILFDSYNYEIDIKGIAQDKSFIQESVFVQTYLKPLLKSTENSYSEGLAKSFRQMAVYRDKYINPKDKNIWRSLLHNNKFVFQGEGDKTYESDAIVDEKTLAKILNYKYFVMPVMRSILLRG